MFSKQKKAATRRSGGIMPGKSGQTMNDVFRQPESCAHCERAAGMGWARDMHGHGMVPRSVTGAGGGTPSTQE
jgi:hypothetical protein